MKPEDFSQFDDPRVREVMAAAANLVEKLHHCGYHEMLTRELRDALFAARHTRPKNDGINTSDDVIDLLKMMIVEMPWSANGCHAADMAREFIRQHTRPEQDGSKTRYDTFVDGFSEGTIVASQAQWREMRARLEKVRDELKDAETGVLLFARVANAIRMLEAILEGKEP